MRALLVTLAAVLLVASVAVLGGVFNISADEAHAEVTHRLLELARKRSVAARARSIDAPPVLRDPALVALGAGHYLEMCMDCHLGRGIESTELH